MNNAIEENMTRNSVSMQGKNITEKLVIGKTSKLPMTIRSKHL